MIDATTKIEKELSDNNLKPSIKLCIKFWGFVIKNQFVVFLGYTLFLLGMSSVSPIFTLVWKKYIDTATSYSGDIKLAILFLLIYIGLKVVLDFCYFFSTKFMDSINFSSWRTLDGAVNKKATQIDCELYEVPNVQNKITRAWNFNHGTYIQLYQLGLESFRLIVQMVGLFVSLYIIHPMVCIVSLLTILPVIVGKIIGDKISKLNERSLTDAYNEVGYYKTAKYDQSLIKEIIVNNSFDFFQKKYEKRSTEIFKKKRNVERKKTVLLLLEELFRCIILMVCIVMVSYQVIIGEMTLGGLAAVFATIINMIYIFINLSKNLGSVYALSFDMGEFYEFMDLQSSGFNAGCQNDEDYGNILIRFNGVDYRYPLTEKYVLKNINVSIKKGQHVAIVGANGSGKTTFVKLLMKLLNPSNGNVVYNKKHLQLVDYRSFWSNFSTVFQDYSKYKDSLGFNVSISNVKKKDDEVGIIEALEKAKFNKNINLTTMLSKEFGGVELSGGEWQKIALARAIFSSNEIFILDEPTSAIDPIKEAEIYKSFNELTYGKTSVFITHRLGSVLYSDLILFFHDGEIVESGTHEELVARKGKYYEFWSKQSSLYMS